MKCKICGAQLKKEGDICSKCYKLYQEEEKLKQDTNVVYKFKRKYSIGFDIMRSTEMVLIMVLASLGCFAAGNIGGGFLCWLALAVLIVLFLIWDKNIANNTKCICYETKMVYKFDFLFIHREKVVKYEDIKNVAFYQTFRQRRNNMGDLCIYAKGAIPGATLLNGFQVKNVGEIGEKVIQVRRLAGLLKEE